MSSTSSNQMSQIRQMPVPQIQNIIAIASGKGGVGKSTLAVNLALSLQKMGKKTGILDADIYGPSQPWMLNIHTTAQVTEDSRLLPVENYGLPSMSIAYLLEDKNTPMIWRGPMVSQALQQMLYNTRWPELDFLIVDLPPGTGDIHLTLTQKIPLKGAIIITTPQEVAVLDAKKALNMFKKMQIPLLGVVENMAAHVCSACGHHETIFGEGGGERLASLFSIPLLGKIPLSSRICAQSDAGIPTVLEADSKLAAYYRAIAEKMIEEIQTKGENVAGEEAGNGEGSPQKKNKKIEIRYET